MAYYSEGGYCAEEVRRPYGNQAEYCHGEGGERYAVRKEYEEIDEVARAGRGHHHLGHSDSHRHAYAGQEGYQGHLGEHREHHLQGHGGRRYDACESKYDSSTGEYYA